MSPCNYVHVLHNGRTIGEVICTCKEGYARVSRLTSPSISLSPKPELAIAEYNRFFDVLCLEKIITIILTKKQLLLEYIAISYFLLVKFTRAFFILHKQSNTLFSYASPLSVGMFWRSEA
jgi:hypothetical protein